MAKVRTTVDTHQRHDERVNELLQPPGAVILNGAQETALLCLLDGKKQKEAAAAAGVTQETVSRWMASDSSFVAELNRRRAELWQAQQDKRRMLTDQALDQLAELLQSDSPKIQLQAIAMALATVSAAPAGPTTPQGVEKQWFNERANDQIGPLDILAAGLVG